MMNKFLAQKQKALHGSNKNMYVTPGHGHTMSMSSRING